MLSSGPRTTAESDSPDTRIALVRDPERLLRPARFLVVVSLTIMAIALGYDTIKLMTLDYSEIGFFRSHPDLVSAVSESEDIWPPNDLSDVIQIATFAIFLLSIIFSCRWIYFSGKNVRALGATGLAISPGWAVGWYFIPIANLWKPYQAMKEIWQASRDPLDWKHQQPSSRLSTWWTMWLILTVTQQFKYSSTVGDLRFPGVGLLMLINIFYAGVTIAMSTAFLMSMDEIKRLQIEAAENRNILSVF